jgi:undecaprenyl diphosphate synthase
MNRENRDRVPKHIGIIMDGNRRWAKSQGLFAVKGHNAGVDRLESTVEHAGKRGIDTMTFWAFSTENWNRSKSEVNALMNVFRDVLKGPMMQRFMKNGVRVRTIGDISRFPEDIRDKAETVVFDSKDNKRINVNLALNYGGREELVYAFNELIKEGKEEVTAEDISSHLYTGGQPDPDLIIRTGGEQRLSGFLPWQAVYSEFYFTDTFWPNFDEKEFDKALIDYSSRERRFGK